MPVLLSSPLSGLLCELPLAFCRFSCFTFRLTSCRTFSRPDSLPSSLTFFLSSFWPPVWPLSSLLSGFLQSDLLSSPCLPSSLTLFQPPVWPPVQSPVSPLPYDLISASCLTSCLTSCCTAVSAWPLPRPCIRAWFSRPPSLPPPALVQWSSVQL